MTDVMHETPIVPATKCPECGHDLQDEVCVNPECKEAQVVASVAAGRETAKATAAAAGARTVADPAASTTPRSYASSGRPD